MANDCPSYYCGDEWDDITNDLCPERFNGGMSAMILLRCGVERADLVQDADPTLLDDAKVQALISGNDAKAIKNIQVTINAPSEETADILSPCEPDVAVNYTRTITIEDPNVNEVRRSFWSSVNSANRFANGGALLYECDADRWTYVDKSLQISGGRETPAKNTELQKFTLTGTYRSKDDAEIFPAADLLP